MFDSKSHQDWETELTKEDQEEEHKVEAGVILECLVGGPEPAEEGQRDKENGPDQGQTNQTSIIQTSKQETQGSKQIGQK